jgi:hypothetical protein
VSVKKSGRQLLRNDDFSGQILHADAARRLRACSLLTRHRQRKSWRVFQLKIKTLFNNVTGYLSLSHTRRTCHVCCTSQYLRILIQDWKQECSLRSHTWRRLMSSGSTVESVYVRCSRLKEYYLSETSMKHLGDFFSLSVRQQTYFL